MSIDGKKVNKEKENEAWAFSLIYDYDGLFRLVRPVLKRQRKIPWIIG